MRRLFAKRADDRISVAQIKRHPWFLQNLPDELSVRQFGEHASVYNKHFSTPRLHDCKDSCADAPMTILV